MSFVKTPRKKAGHTVPAGCKASVYNGQLLVSTGVASFDALLGGGVAVGTMLLVEQDAGATYGTVLLKCFLSEGLACGHHVFISSVDQAPAVLAQHLYPLATVNSAPAPPDPAHAADDALAHSGLKIAWRYDQLGRVQSEVGAVEGYSHGFDVSAQVSAADLARASAAGLLTLTPPDSVASYAALVAHVRKTHFAFTLGSTPPATVLRVGIHALASPLWPDSEAELVRALLQLKALARTALAVVMVTIPVHLLQPHTLASVRRHCDAVVTVQAFAGTPHERNPALKDYHGLFKIHKLARVNTLAHHVPDTFDLAFKLRRKAFVIEKLHLPPDLADEPSRASAPRPTVAAGAGAGSLCSPAAHSRGGRLDF